MNVLKSILVCCMLPATFEARAQVPSVLPQVRVKDAIDSKVTVVLERQESAPLPTMYGDRIETETIKGDRLRVGVSEVIDGGQQVIVLFSVVNTSRHAILLMPPQVQLGGKIRSGRIVKHERWAAAEQLAIIDFRLSHRRLGTGSRADGVVVLARQSGRGFDPRPPHCALPLRATRLESKQPRIMAPLRAFSRTPPRGPELPLHGCGSRRT